MHVFALLATDLELNTEEGEDCMISERLVSMVQINPEL